VAAVAHAPAVARAAASAARVQSRPQRCPLHGSVRRWPFSLWTWTAACRAHGAGASSARTALRSTSTFVPASSMARRAARSWPQRWAAPVPAGRHCRPAVSVERVARERPLPRRAAQPHPTGGRSRWRSERPSVQPVAAVAQAAAVAAAARVARVATVVVARRRTTVALPAHTAAAAAAQTASRLAHTAVALSPQLPGKGTPPCASTSSISRVHRRRC
jgi:hypothetical protein